YWKQNEKGHCESLARQVHRASPLHLHASNPRPVIHRQAEVVADSECRHVEKILEVRSDPKQHQHVGSYEDSLDDCDRTGQDEDDVQSPQRVGIIDNLRTCSPYEIKKKKECNVAQPVELGPGWQLDLQQNSSADEKRSGNHEQ